MSRNAGRYFTNAQAMNPAEHDIVIQTLNQWREVLDEDGSKKLVYFGSDAFEGTESEWEKVPVVFTKKGHPKTPFHVDPVKALQEIEGEIIGHPGSVRIDKTGTTRLIGKSPLSDPKHIELHENGELVLSSGFFSQYDDDGKLNQRVIPDHIIVFQPTESLRPQDLGAMFLNATGKPHNVAESIERIIGTLRKTLIANATGTLYSDQSIDSRTNAIREAISAAEGITFDSNEFLMIQDLFPESAIYRISGRESDQLFRRDYVSGPNGITVGEPMPVKMAYVPADTETIPPAVSENTVPDALKPGLTRWAVLNATTGQNADQRKELDPVMNASEGAGAGSGETMTEPPKEDLSAAIGAKDTIITNLQAEITARDARIKAFEDEKAEQARQELDRKWDVVKSNYLTLGETLTAEDETRLKAEFMEKPHDFVINAMKSREPPRKKEGEEFIGNSTRTDEEKEIDESVSKLKATRRGRA